MATAKELRELSTEDLQRRAAELRTTILTETMQLRTATLPSVAARTAHRRDLARVLMVITEKAKK